MLIIFFLSNKFNVLHLLSTRAQRFFLLNVNAMIHAVYLGLIAIASSPTLLKVLMFTKQSSTTMLSYRRYKANVLHLQAWYKFPLKPGTR